MLIFATNLLSRELAGLTRCVRSLICRVFTTRAIFGLRRKRERERESERQREKSLLTTNRWLKVGKYNASCGWHRLWALAAQYMAAITLPPLSGMTWLAVKQKRTQTVSGPPQSPTRSLEGSGSKRERETKKEKRKRVWTTKNWMVKGTDLTQGLRRDRHIASAVHDRSLYLYWRSHKPGRSGRSASSRPAGADAPKRFEVWIFLVTWIIFV